MFIALVGKRDLRSEGKQAEKALPRKRLCARRADNYVFGRIQTDLRSTRCG